MRKFSSMVAGLTAATVLALSGSAAVFAADSPSGQIEMGNIYRVRNITTNAHATFVDSASATCNDTVQFRAIVHNPGPDPVTNVKVSATLDGASGTSHSSKVSITADNVGGEIVTDTAGVNLDKAGTLSYISGSTQLVDPNGNVLNALPDGMVNGAGVNIGTVGVSTQQIRGVQFKAKVSCPVTPITPPTTPPTTPPQVKGVTTLPSTGAGDVLGIFSGASALGAAGHFIVARRRRG